MKLKIPGRLYLCIKSYEGENGKSEFTAGQIYVSTRKDEDNSMMLECIDDNGDLNAFGVKNFVQVNETAERPLEVNVGDKLLYIGRDSITNNDLKLSFGSGYKCRGVYTESRVWVHNDVNEAAHASTELFIPYPTLPSNNTPELKENLCTGSSDNLGNKDFKYNVYYVEECKDKSISFDKKEDAATWCGNFLTTAENDEDNYIMRVVYGKEVPFTSKATIEVTLG